MNRLKTGDWGLSPKKKNDGVHAVVLFFIPETQSSKEGIPHMQYLWTDGRQSRNAKIGRIPTAYPADRAAAWESCAACPLRHARPHRTMPNGQKRFVIEAGNPACYFWNGNGNIAFSLPARYPHRDYSLDAALKNRWRGARAVRMSAGGDPSGNAPEEYRSWERQVRREGLAWLDYTHFWRGKGSWLRGHAMASVDTLAEAVAAVRAGWRAAVHVASMAELPQGRPQGKLAGGIRYTLCPAIRKPGQVTCNDCRLCDASHAACEVIVFINH